MDVPYIKVGILHGKQIRFSLNGHYFDEQGNLYDHGEWLAVATEDGIRFSYSDLFFDESTSVTLKPKHPNSNFVLSDVTIGIGFHWERKEKQTFQSCLQLLLKDGEIWAINQLSIEDYLTSVISSEMSATSSVELLKAHAVISRSWLLAQIEKNKNLHSKESSYASEFRTEDELIKWYDREDHKNFHVCADDHCQRFQGITRATTPYVDEAVKETWGQILSYDGKICDARFSKCCGGMTETFENAWESVPHAYLQQLVDAEQNPSGFKLDLTNETSARDWILGKPDAFCNTNNKKVLSQVLNDYDQETNDFYRWEVTYTQEELSELAHQRSGINFGLINDLIPMERGVSGRITKLKIIGEKQTFTIGKELEIRKTLSKTHLYSSAFVVIKSEMDGKPIFTLKGAGWGHGVGLCQIGAAMMGDKGYSYKEILNHYFRGAILEEKY